MTRVLRIPAAIVVVLVAFGFAGEASAKVPPRYRNCAALNAQYPHGLGLTTARDKTTGTPPVRNFFKSNRFFRLAMSYNRGLDRDHDGIACEKQ
jgi:hypothetical protein